MDSSTDLNPGNVGDNCDTSSNADENIISSDVADITNRIDNLEFLDAEEQLSTTTDNTCLGQETKNCHPDLNEEGLQQPEAGNSSLYPLPDVNSEDDFNIKTSSSPPNTTDSINETDHLNVSNCDSVRSDSFKGDNSADCDTVEPEVEAHSDEEEEYHSAEEGEEDIAINEEYLKEIEETLTEEEKKTRREQAQELKEEGNKLFKEAQYSEARKAYGKALQLCPLAFPKDRSIMYSNRAACHMRSEEFEKAIEDSSKALELNPHYVKALQRRAELYEKSEKLDDALADYTKLVEMDPSNHLARTACMRLPDQIKERNEKMKEEMMGKLKELGNMVLKPFGLSTNNFQLQQDPNTGGYSVQFNNNGS